MQQLHDSFRAFGLDVVSEVEYQLRMHRSLVPLLSRFNLPTVGSSSDHSLVLVNFIHRYGVSLFLRASRSGVDAAQIERWKRLAGCGQFVGRTIDLRRNQSTEFGPPLVPEGPNLGRRASDRMQAAPLGIPIADDAPPPWIEVPGYAGPERRSLRTRRKGPCDRRQDAAPIYFRNRRQRTDRRQTLRRADDRLACEP